MFTCLSSFKTFLTIWFILIYFSQFWPIFFHFDKYGSTFSIPILFDSVWPILIHFVPMDQFWHIWPIVIQSDSFTHFCPLWPKLLNFKLFWCIQNSKKKKIFLFLLFIFLFFFLLIYLTHFITSWPILNHVWCSPRVPLKKNSFKYVVKKKIYKIIASGFF